MEQIIVHKNNGSSFPLIRKEPLCILEKATQQMALMGDDSLSLSVKSLGELDFSYGDRITIYGRDYHLRSEPSIQRLGENMFLYNLQFMGVMYELLKSQYRNTDSQGKASSSSFDLTGKLTDFIRLITFNSNRNFAGLWSFDEASCPETDNKTLSFSKENCLAALQRIVKEYEQEFAIEQHKGQRIIKIGKHGKTITPPSGACYFEYGKGKGLYELQLQKLDDKAVVTRLWVEGSQKNIRSDYRGYSQRLQLPIDKILNEDKRYVQDQELSNSLGDIIEDSEFFDDIYPTRVGEVTKIDEKDILSFYDEGMDFNLNERDNEGQTKYLINKVSAKIVFNTGSLAGQEFELSKYDHKNKKFKIIEYSDARGLKFPNPDSEAFRIRKGDTYKLLDINLPDSYVTNAENKLWEEANKTLNDRKQPRASYTQKFDKMYFAKYLPHGSSANIFLPGDYVPIKDTRLAIEKNIQIQKLTRNLLDKHDYTLELSDITSRSSVISDTVASVIEHDKILTNNRLKDPIKAQRGWRSTEELRNMVYDPDGYFDTENIKPNSIDTNMLAVGVKSQQFILQDVRMQTNYEGKADVFNASEGKLIHLALDEGLKEWKLGSITYTLDDEGGYYVFARCSKTAPTGIFVVSQTRFTVEPEDDVNNYYFQIGIIGSKQNGFRDFNSTYGFTRINGNTITTGRIVTSDGESFLDLDGNKFRIGDKNSSIDWNDTKKNQLTLSNVKLLSSSGEVSGIGVFRGVYQKDMTYYTDDQVTYNGSTYRYTHNNPAKGVLPTEATHWTVVAAKGDSPALVYRGLYDSSKVYYGTSNRVDAVKYGDIYYVAKIDAGEGFSGKIPTDTKYWNNFGAQFETISTNLLLAESAQIGDWYHSKGKIVSTLGSGNKITLDAKRPEILVENSSRSGRLRLDGYYNEISLSGYSGSASISPGRIYSNPNNSSHGGEIRDLYAHGLRGSIKYIYDSSSMREREIRRFDTFVIGLVNYGTQTVWLPNDCDSGKIIIIKQMSIGTLRIIPESGFYMADDDSYNSDFYLRSGNVMIAILADWYQGGHRRVWTATLISSFI